MRRKYTLEFKQEAAKLVTEQGYSRSKAAQVLGIPGKNICRWVNEQTGKNRKNTDKIKTPEQEEIRQLRKENERLRMEREILKKAAAFFANEKS
jgi:transposase